MASYGAMVVAGVAVLRETVCATPYPALHLLSYSLPLHTPTQMILASRRSSSAQIGLRQRIIDGLREVPELPAGWDAITGFIFFVVQICHHPFSISRQVSANPLKTQTRTRKSP